MLYSHGLLCFFFFQAEDGIRDIGVTGVQTCALPIFGSGNLRATVSQNLIFIDIPNAKTAELARELGQIGMHVEGSVFWRGAVACTRSEERRVGKECRSRWSPYH